MRKATWPTVRLGDHVDLLSGFAFKSKRFTRHPEDIPLIKGANVHQGFIDWNDAERWPADDGEDYGKFFLQSEDVVLAMDRPWIEAGLKWAWIRPEHPKCLLVQRVSRMRGVNGLTSRYLRYVIGGPDFTDYIKPIVTGVTVPHISGEQIRAFRCPLPPVGIQHKIASILSTYDDLIENNTRRIVILEKMAQSLYREWFIEFRFPGHEKARFIDSTLGRIPEGWDLKTLADLCVENKGIQTGPFGSQLHQSDYSNDGVPVLMPKDIIDSRIDLDSVARVPEEICSRLARHRLQEGDIVYGRRGDIGRKTLIRYDQSGWLCGTGCMRLRPNQNRILARFMFDSLGRPEVVGLIAGKAAGAIMPNLNVGILSSIPLLVPPLNSQASYDQFIVPMFSEVATLVLKNERLRTTRDLLLPKLMSGQVNVEDQNIDIGESLAEADA